MAADFKLEPGSIIEEPPAPVSPPPVAPVAPKKPWRLSTSKNGGYLLAECDGLKMKFTLNEDGLQMKEIAGGGLIKYRSFDLEELWAAGAGQKPLF